MSEFAFEMLVTFLGTVVGIGIGWVIRTVWIDQRPGDADGGGD